MCPTDGRESPGAQGKTLPGLVNRDPADITRKFH